MGLVAQFWLERTPDKREVDGSSPSRPTIFGGVAQLGERLPCTQEVIGSIPFTSTSKDNFFLKLGNELSNICFWLNV